MTRRRGANALEFTLTLPVLLMIVAGLFDWSWLAFQRSAMKAAVSEGCRAASLVDPGDRDRGLDALIDRGTAVMLDRVDDLGAPAACAQGCEVAIDLVGDPPGRIVRCSLTGHFEPIWGLYVSPQDLAVSDLDRLAWQRWTTP